MIQLELASDDLAGLLKHLVDRIPGAETAILLTSDGQATASWGGVFPWTAADVSVLESALRTLVEVAGRHRRLGPRWQTIVALDQQIFALAPAGPDAVLGVTVNGRATLDSVLDDTASAAEQAWRLLAAHEVRFDPPAWSVPTRSPGMLQQRRKHRRSVEPYPPGRAACGTAPVAPAPVRPADGRHAAQTGDASLTGCDPNQPSNDQLERMLARLRSL